MQKKIFYLYVTAIASSLIIENSAQTRKFRSIQPGQSQAKDKLKITIKSSGKNENSPFCGLFKRSKHRPLRESGGSKSETKQVALYDKIGFDWAQTTTQNLETAVGYFLSIIPDDQEELRSSLKKKESKTKDRIKSAEVIGDQNYKEAEFLSDKLAMVANWHRAAQEQFKLAVDKKEESMGGLMYKDFVKAKSEAQKELLYEIYAMLDGVCPNPNKSVDMEKLHEKINEVIEDVFSKIEKPKAKPKKQRHAEKNKEAQADKDSLETKESETKNSTQEDSEEVKKLQESETKLKEDLASAQKALKEADREKKEAIAKAEKLKNDLESEQRSLKAEEIKREIELKRTANEKIKLENKNSALEKKIQELEDKKMELKTKIEVLSENVKQESTGKTMTSIDLEKIRRQKEALEKKLEKQKQKINEYLSLLSNSDAKQKENEIKQINLEIEIKKLKLKILELETEKNKTIQKVESKSSSSESAKSQKEPLILDVEKDTKNLSEPTGKNEAKKTLLGEAQSLFDEFPNPKAENPEPKPAS